METGPPSPTGDKPGSGLDEHIGQRLRAQRMANGLQLVTISSALGVTESRVSGWEAGRYRIPSQYLLLVARLLSCSLATFFEGYPHEFPADDEIDARDSRMDWLFNRFSAKH